MVIENFKVGGLEAYGLDYERSEADQPAPRSTAPSPASARTGPYAPRAGYDFLIQGMGGLMSITGRPRRRARRRPA